MALKKIVLVTLLAALAQCEPPVQTGYNYNPPSTNYGAPIQHRAPSQHYRPSSSYNAPSTNYGAPSANYHAPSSNYHAPSSNYHAPSTNYGAPSANYHAPSSNYHAPSTNYGAPSTNYGAPSGHGGDYHGDHGHDNEVPKSYEFGYSVKDAQSGNDYDRKEVSDGNTVRGEYRVQLPDGRTQIVTYHADWQTGFHADVRYEGEAHYPEQTHGHSSNAYLPPQQGYNAPSGFSGSLTGFHGNTNQPSSSYGPPGYHH